MISQELLGLSEGAFLRVYLYLVLSEEIELFTQVEEMVRTSNALHKQVVDVYLHGMPDQIFEHSVNHPLKGGSGVL